MCGKEDVQQCAVINFLRIKINLHRLGMPRFSRTDLGIGRVLFFASRVPRNGFFHSADLLKGGLYAPETSSSKSGCVNFAVIQGRFFRRFTGFILLAITSKRQDKQGQERKSTRLNSSHVKISYAVFCLKKK